MSGKWNRNGWEPDTTQAQIDDITESIERLSDLIKQHTELLRQQSVLLDECLGRVDAVEASLGWWEARR